MVELLQGSTELISLFFLHCHLFSNIEFTVLLVDVFIITFSETFEFIAFASV